MRKISSCERNGIIFPDLGSYCKCRCIGDCFWDGCDNAEAAVYCTPSCCKPGACCSNRKYVYVDAAQCSSITRFVSHTYDPNAVFVELQNRSSVKVLIKMIKDVKAGAEITVHYGNERWFNYACDDCWQDGEATTATE
eukprot:jgi/Phyca11/109543/e_gw1.17.471.1